MSDTSDSGYHPPGTSAFTPTSSSPNQFPIQKQQENGLNSEPSAHVDHTKDQNNCDF